MLQARPAKPRAAGGQGAGKRWASGCLRSCCAAWLAGVPLPFTKCWGLWSRTSICSVEEVRSFSPPSRLRGFSQQWRWSLSILLHCLWRTRCQAHLSDPGKVAAAISLIRIWRADLSLQLRLAFHGRQVEEPWRVGGQWMSADPRPTPHIQWPLPAPAVYKQGQLAQRYNAHMVLEACATPAPASHDCVAEL